MVYNQFSKKVWNITYQVRYKNVITTLWHNSKQWQNIWFAKFTNNITSIWDLIFTMSWNYHLSLLCSYVNKLITTLSQACYSMGNKPTASTLQTVHKIFIFLFLWQNGGNLHETRTSSVMGCSNCTIILNCKNEFVRYKSYSICQCAKGNNVL